MKHAVLIFWLMSLPAVFAQQPKPKKTTPVTSTAKAKTNVVTPKKIVAAVRPKATPTPLSEKEQFEKASAYELAADRVAALEKFLTAFPQSENRPAAAELLASSRLLIAEEKLLSGDAAGAIALFKLIVEQMPQPVPNDLFTDSIAKIPSTLFFRGQRPAALELAAAIESKVENNAAQLLEIANFHLATENGGQAMRVAAKAAAKDPTSAAVQRTIALAHRINFDLDLSADAYAKSVELEPDSVASKRGLAEMKRALGKSDDAVALYRELLAKNDGDLQSRTGMILALFDAGKRSEAEAELAKSLEQTPGNVILLAGAAYWYASKGIGDRAVELAEKAVAREPRYIWSHIALARGLMSQKKPVEAEQVLMKARAYGNFPTLEYELASARMAAGFYREAAEDLQKQFAVVAGGNVRTNLGGRVVREEKSLSDLVAFERRASIFTPIAADSAETAEALKALLSFEQKLQAAQPDEAEVATAADAFVAGSDKMKIHRQIYAASALLQKRVALGKVLELARAATGNTDAGLEVANPRSAVMAAELYEARSTAFRRNEFLLVPEVPNQTLSAIMRGRIEEIAGWALFQQNNFPDAIIRLRRAISVMPDKSAWWRSSMWRLGAALAADGKEAEALNSYIESYKTDKPDYAKYAVVEALYKKLNGSTEGLEEKIGRDRVAVTPAITEIRPAATPAPGAEVPVTETNAAPSAIASPTPTVSEPMPDPPKITEVKSNETPKSETTPVDKPIDIKTEAPAKTEPPVVDQPAKPVTDDVRPTVDKPSETKTEVPAKTETVSDDQQSKPVTENAQPTSSVQEPKPLAETKVSEPKTDPAANTLTTNETPIEQPVKERPTTNKSKAEPKPLFEPIIITVPDSRPRKSSDSVTTDKKDSAAPVADKKSDGPAPAGELRPRVIDGQEVKSEEVPPCTVGVSQENISLINGGGNVGILVSVDAPGDIKTLTAISSSPKDIELTLEPEIGGISDRRFYVIKSISSAVGVYQVTFATVCGKKDVIVTVR
jgi:tetratricopeptide (TPR) repeat protein